MISRNGQFGLSSGRAKPRAQHTTPTATHLARAVAGVALLAGLHGAAVAAPYIYSIVDLGTLGGNASVAYGINNVGQVVGSARTASGQEHATLFSGAGSGNTNLGTLGGGSSNALSINNAGQVVGWAYTVGNATYRATLFSGTGSGNTDLGTLGGSSSYAYAINDAGQAVGAAQTAGGVQRATLFAASGNIDLGTLWGTYSDAYGINNSRQIVGSADSSGGQGALYRAALYTNTGNIDQGSLGGPYSAAYDVNNNGQIVGWAHNSSGWYHATLFSGTGGGNTDLGTLGGGGSVAYGINDLGQVVGYSNGSFSGTEAFLWKSDTGMVNLENLFDPLLYAGWDLEEARGINDSGQIVGYGFHNGQTRAFLMTLLPTDNGSDIPEPGTLALLGAALLLLALRTNMAQRRGLKPQSSAGWALLCGALLSLHGASHASLVTYSDKPAFLADTGATSATGPLANVGPVSSHVFGTVEIRAQRYFSGPNVSEGVPDVTTRLPGNDIGISFGVGNTSNENLDVRLLGGPAYAFGFDFVEPQFDPNVNATFVDSTFQVNLFNGLTLIDSFSFNAPNDVAAFVGVSSTAAFDNVQIREVVGGAENEFFGQFYTGANATNTGGDVPEPGTLALLGMGLLLLTGLNARRASAFN